MLSCEPFLSFFFQRIVETDYSMNLQAVIFWTFAYRGSASEAEALLAPFNNIEAVYDEMGDVSLPDISIIQGTSEGTASCAPNHTWITSTAGIKTYNITTTRQIYALNNAYIQQYPQLQSPSVVQEGYSNAAVRSIPAEDSAFPFREYNILTYVPSFMAPTRFRPEVI